jgi:hypothetical protein
MKVLKALVLVFFVFQTSVGFCQDDFEKRWNLEKAKPFAGMRIQTLHALRDRHVLFISGILNELPGGGYFANNIRAVKKEIGATASVYSPSSFRSIKENRDRLYRKIYKRYREYRKPLILFGHSKGGAEALAAILHYPELILNGIVDRVVIIQGAIGGSPVSDSFEACGMLKVLPKKLKKGVLSLTPARAKELFNEESLWASSHLQAHDLELISSRVFYLRSAKDPRKAGFRYRRMGTYLQKTYGPNDGVLLVQDQMLSSVGNDLGILENRDHSSEVIQRWFCGKNDDEQRALTRAVLEAIYE